jgi:hypothetical protein
MTTTTWITMLLIMSFVWGGFGWLLLTALRKESSKESSKETPEQRSARA